MISAEYVEFILETKRKGPLPREIDEVAVYETAQLLSGDFTYLLYEALWVRGFDMEAITQHLEDLYDSEGHVGLVYFVFILANATDAIVHVLFSEMSANDALIPILSAAIIEDWLECHAAGAPTEEPE